MVGADLAGLLWADVVAGNDGDFAVHLLLSLIVTALVYGGFVYQFSRLKYVQRLRDHAPVSEDELEDFYTKDAPPLAILVPSYKEERSVVEMTLMSAALQDYPKRSITLLLDDPPTPGNAEDVAQLASMRLLPAALQEKFEAPKRRMRTAYTAYRTRAAKGPLDPAAEYRRLVELYAVAAQWVTERIAEFEVTDAASRVFRYKVLY